MVFSKDIFEVKEEVKDGSNFEFEFQRYTKEIQQKEWVSKARNSGDRL